MEERISMGVAATEFADEPALPAAAPPPAPPTPSGAPTLSGLLEDYERAIIVEAVRQSGGVKSRAAKALSIKRTTLVERMKKLRL